MTLASSLFGSPGFKLVAAAVIAHVAPLVGCSVCCGDQANNADGDFKFLPVRKFGISIKRDPLPEPCAPASPRPSPHLLGVTALQGRDMVESNAFKDVAFREAALPVDPCQSASKHPGGGYNVPSTELADLKDWFPRPGVQISWTAPPAALPKPKPKPKRYHRFMPMP